MNHEQTLPGNYDPIQVSESTKNRTYWLSRPFVGPELKKKLEKASILVVPQEGFRDHQGPVFPVKTEELFSFLRERAPKGVEVDICIEDADYRELALHDATIIIGTFLVMSLAVPVAKDMISEYLKRRIFGKPKNNDIVRFRMLIDESDQGRSRTLDVSYDGPASQFDKLMDWKGKAIPPGPAEDKND